MKKELKKVLEAMVGVSLLVGGIAMNQHWIIVAGALELAKIVAE